MILRVALAALAALLAWCVLSAGTPPVDLAAEALAAAPRSGAAHPVTAVLLGFRAYDTLLEVAVLLLAVLAAAPTRQRPAQEADAVLGALVGGVVPLMVLVAGYLLWAGSTQPGGAFQAGAVLAAAGVLLGLAGRPPSLDPAGPMLRIALAAGLAVFLAAFVSDTLPRLILVVEAALTVSIATALLCLFTAARR